MKNHVMLDTETMGTAPGSVILTIGAVLFDPNELNMVSDCLTAVDPAALPEADLFYRRLRVTPAINRILTVDADTVKWWNEQPLKARHEAFESEPRTKSAVALEEFFSWFISSRASYIWSHGASFDVVLVEEAVRRLWRRRKTTHPTTPWKFWNIRDTRTLFDVANIKPFRGDNHHHALHDAVDQAASVQRAYDRLGRIAT